MTPHPSTKQAAAERYAARRNDIARMLDVLDMELQRHGKRMEAEPRNWGLAGDLDLVRNNLIDTVAFISGMEREDVQRFLDDASGDTRPVGDD